MNGSQILVPLHMLGMLSTFSLYLYRCLIHIISSVLKHHDLIVILNIFTSTFHHLSLPFCMSSCKAVTRIIRISSAYICITKIRTTDFIDFITSRARLNASWSIWNGGFCNDISYHQSVNVLSALLSSYNNHSSDTLGIPWQICVPIYGSLLMPIYLTALCQTICTRKSAPMSD